MSKLSNYLLTAIISLFFLILSSGHAQAKNILSDSKIQGRLNIINGASSECVMHHFYTQSGWIKIEGEIGRNGIDGLYYKKKNNTIREVLVAESKWNKSKLGKSGKNKAIKQMSQEWVLKTLDNLVRKLHAKAYTRIQQFIKQGQYRARLFRLKPTGRSGIQVTIYRIKNKGLKIFEEIQDTQLKPIDINRPKNSFEKGLVSAYNDCRKTYLHKYLGTLSNAAISALLKDNYIQTNDVKRALNSKGIITTKAINRSVPSALLYTPKKVSPRSIKKPSKGVTGKVWVNTKSHVYHCSGSRWYGKTKHGKYLNEVAAIRIGNRPSQGSYCSTVGKNTNRKIAQSVSSSNRVWVNTKSHVYHCSGARWYGKTKHGVFMSESDAIRRGNRGARGHKC